jgi:hypothetical protein
MKRPENDTTNLSDKSVAKALRGVIEEFGYIYLSWGSPPDDKLPGCNIEAVSKALAQQLNERGGFMKSVVARTKEGHHHNRIEQAQHVCCDGRHETPCPQPCQACVEECDPSLVIAVSDATS